MNDLKLEKVNIYDFSNIYDDMLQQFPPGELKSYEVFKKLLSDGILKCYKAVDNTDEVGYVIYTELKNGDKWLEYIAIKKEFQSKGYGRKILALLNNCYMEVEKPDEKLPDTLRRIKFYTSLSAKRLDVNYIYPNNTGGLPMDLYYLGDSTPDKAGVIDTISEIFTGLHSDVKNIDKIFNKISMV